MKKIASCLITLFLTLSINQKSQAQEVAPKPVEVSKEAAELAEMIMSKGAEECITKLKESAYQIDLSNIISGVSYSGNITDLSFLAKEGGDMVRGVATLRLKRNSSIDIFGNPSSYVTCAVAIPE